MQFTPKEIAESYQIDINTLYKWIERSTYLGKAFKKQGRKYYATSESLESCNMPDYDREVMDQKITIGFTKSLFTKLQKGAGNEPIRDYIRRILLQSCQTTS